MINEKEFEIGKTFGPGTFYAYCVIRNNPDISLKDLEFETGLSDRQLKVFLSNLLDCGIISREKTFLRHCSGYIYKTVDEQNKWKLN